MGFLIDRRLNSKKKSTVNRQRFMRRYRKQIRDAVAENLRGRSITDTKTGEKVSIPAKDINEPHFVHGKGGRVTHILPGNDQYVTGDRFPRPSGDGGTGGGSASNKGEGMDDFVFEISQKEFLDALFEDMELPNLTKRQLAGSEEFKKVKAGFSSEGTPANISIIRSMKSATARRIALGASKRTELRELEKQLSTLLSNEKTATEKTVSEEIRVQRRELEKKIDQLREQLARIPFLDDFDIKYHRHTKEPVPHSKAVMFCLMDVSGSMDQATKDLAKRFFILLYLFLSRNYDKTDVVFIRHHTTAKEVDEEEFFYSRETGGTVVSSALKLMKTIIQDRYPIKDWNIYGAQASDGDNWPEDGSRCMDLIQKLLPLTQYYAYIEITDQGNKPLWETYSKLLKDPSSISENAFAMQHIKGTEDIYPVFHELFRKQSP